MSKKLFIAVLASCIEANSFEKCGEVGEPINAEQVLCDGNSCTFTCKNGFKAFGRKRIKCREQNGSFSWVGSFGQCLGCNALDTVQGAMQRCATHSKGLPSCRQACSDQSQLFWVGNQQFFPRRKLNLNCRCLKVNGSLECAFQHYLYGKVTQRDIDAFACSARNTPPTV